MAAQTRPNPPGASIAPGEGSPEPSSRARGGPPAPGRVPAGGPAEPAETRGLLPWISAQILTTIAARRATRMT